MKALVDNREIQRSSAGEIERLKAIANEAIERIERLNRMVVLSNNALPILTRRTGVLRVLAARVAGNQLNATQAIVDGLMAGEDWAKEMMGDMNLELQPLLEKWYWEVSPVELEQRESWLSGGRGV